jgi:hypothetical protein
MIADRQARAWGPAAAHFRVQNHGSLVLLVPQGIEAQAWADAHLPEDVMHWGDALVIEPRYIRDILDRVAADGLTYAWGY